MPDPSFTLHRPLHYPCPYCGAASGWACSTLDNRPSKLHASRLALAKGKQRDGSSQEADRG